MNMKKWMTKWTTEKWYEDKQKRIFEALYRHTDAVETMIDIGCGLAHGPEYYQKKCGAKLWLLDGDVSYTEDRKREIGYSDVDTFKFYTPISELKESYDERGLDYTFVDAYNIDIPEDVKFDLFYSTKSCGFHYPANTYRDFVKKHSHENSIVIFDIKNDSKQDDFIVKNVIYEDKLSKYLEIEFK